MRQRRSWTPTATLCLAVVLAAVTACSPSPTPSAVPLMPSPGPTTAASASPDDGSAARPSPIPSPPPAPGHELYGFLPYWEMDASIAEHLRATPLTTLALFSVTNTAKGAVNVRQPGYRSITGTVGRQVIREARQRGVHVELVFTSFGTGRNRKLLTNVPLQDSTIEALVALASDLGVHGINVDVESLDPLLVESYGSFVGRLRSALVTAIPDGSVSVATTANPVGAAMALAAVEGGADRVFMMGYDYRVAASSPGATSPLSRRDGGQRDLPWSLDLYAAMGVPVQRTILGLPLYGMTWPVAGPFIGDPATGRGKVWIPRRNLDTLGNPRLVPQLDAIEQVDVYVLGSDGSTGPPPSASIPPSWGPPGAGSPAPGGTPTPAGAARPAGTQQLAGTPLPAVTAPPPPAATPAPTGPGVTWQAIYVDSPATLTPKLALADARGLAGAGFWAIGYERGLPGYAELMSRFAAGKLGP